MRDWIDKGAWRHQPCVALDKVGQIVPVSTAQRKWIRDDTYLIMLDDYQDQADRWAKIAGFPKRDIPRLNMSSRPPHWGLCYTDKQIKNLLRYYHDDLLMWQSLSQYHKQKVEA